MNKKERYERESTAKGGSVPPDLRRHSKARQTHITKVEIERKELADKLHEAQKRD